MQKRLPDPPAAGSLTALRNRFPKGTMRRALVLFVTLVLAMSLGAALAVADSTRVLNGVSFSGSQGFNPHLSCTSPGTDVDPETTSVDLIPAYTTDPTPLGTRALRIHPDGDHDQASGVAAYTPTPSSATFEARIGSPEGAASGFAIAYYLPPGDNLRYWVGYHALTSSVAWQTASGATTFTWVAVDRGTGQTGRPSAPSTLASFVSSHGGDATSRGGGAFLGFVFGCDGRDVLLDALRVGSPGAVDTYDLEGYQVGAAIRTGREVIVAGEGVKVTGFMDDSLTVYTKIPFVLEAKPYGASDFSYAGTSTFRIGDNIPGAPLTVSPITQTVYRYRIEARPSTAGAVSDEITVYVRTRVSIAAPERIRRGRRIVVSGGTTPAKRLLPAVLQARTGSRWLEIDRGATTDDGRYEFAVNAYQLGTARLRVLVAGGDGNSTGTSPTKMVLVRR